MIVKIFNEHFACKKNILSRIDPRIKLLLVTSAIILTICSPSPILPLMVASLFLGSLIIIKIPSSLLLLRLVAPLSISIVILILQIFFYGQTPWFEFNIAGLHLIGFKEGLDQGILITSKVIGAVSSMLFLTMTTSVPKLLFAASCFRIPSTFIEVTMLTYRYIFVLLESVLTIKDAQKLRLGYATLRVALSSWGNLAGAVVVKAYHQATQTHQAMISRGYCGKIVMESEEKFALKDMLVIFIAVATLVLIYWGNFYRI